jgi:uncharacterized protein YbjQ (UPF0145 family)
MDGMGADGNPDEKAPPKKDMTSLFDLAQREPLAEPEDGGVLLEAPTPEVATDADFGNLNDLSNAMAAIDPVASGQGSGSFAAPTPEAPAERMVDMSIPPPPEGGSFGGLEGLELGAMPSAADEAPSFETLAPPEAAPEPVAEPEPAVDPAPALEPEPAAEPELAAESEPEAAFEPAPETVSEPAPDGGAEPVAATSADIVDTGPVVAPPPNAPRAQVSKSAPKGGQSLDSVKKFGEKFAIGHPRIEASPPFSLLATFHSTEKVISRIRDVLTADDYGVQFKDVEVQMKSGKLLVPKVSEFAAVTLAMKLRDVVDDIEVGLSSEIFKAKTPGVSDSDFDNVLFASDLMQMHSEDVKDLGAEPKTEKELFATNLDQIEGYKVTRILTAITVSKIVPNEIAEDPKSGRLEDETDVLTRELVARAFKLGAHGVIGLTFTLKSYEIDAPLGKKKGYRLWGSGTAVRVRTVAQPSPSP